MTRKELAFIEVEWPQPMTTQYLDPTRVHETQQENANGAVERDENSGKCYWRSESNRHAAGLTYNVPDRETGALKRLAAIMARYPSLRSYVQGDPRGCALYILRPGDVPQGGDPSAYYSRGIAVY